MRGRNNLELMKSQHQFKLTIKTAGQGDRPRQGGRPAFRSEARDMSTHRNGHYDVYLAHRGGPGSDGDPAISAGVAPPRELPERGNYMLAKEDSCPK